MCSFLRGICPSFFLYPFANGKIKFMIIKTNRNMRNFINVTLAVVFMLTCLLVLTHFAFDTPAWLVLLPIGIYAFFTVAVPLLFLILFSAVCVIYLNYVLITGRGISVGASKEDDDTVSIDIALGSAENEAEEQEDDTISDNDKNISESNGKED